MKQAINRLRGQSKKHPGFNPIQYNPSEETRKNLSLVYEKYLYFNPTVFNTLLGCQ